jgi:hypothetical protein
MGDHIDDLYVIPAGYLIVKIDNRGHIRRWGKEPFRGQIPMEDYLKEAPESFCETVHLESRGLHELPDCRETFVEAHRYLPVDPEICILELTSEGGGSKIWMREEQKELLTQRLDWHRGCYGGWSVWTLNEGGI